MGKRTNSQAGVESESTVTSNSQNKPRGLYYWGNFVKIVVSATELCRCNKSHKFCVI